MFKSRGNRKPVNKPCSVDYSFLLASRLIGFYLLFLYSGWNHLAHYSSLVTFSRTLRAVFIFLLLGSDVKALFPLSFQLNSWLVPFRLKAENF